MKTQVRINMTGLELGYEIKLVLISSKPLSHREGDFLIAFSACM
jgi:hypothetical protein